MLSGSGTNRTPTVDAPLRLEHVRWTYPAGAWELNIPHLSLGNEAMCGIIGPNGAGKSTLLKIAAGLLQPASGDVFLQKNAIFSLKRREIAQKLGFLPQECPALFDYTVAQIAALGRHAYGGTLDLPNATDRAAVERALAAVGLENLQHRAISQLSGGERRRAWLAAALAQEPDILLLDEPTQALDVHQASVMMSVLADKAAGGLRVVAVLHDLNLAALFCHRLILMQNGCVVADGAPADVLTRDFLLPVYGDKLDVFWRENSKIPIILAKK